VISSQILVTVFLGNVIINTDPGKGPADKIWRLQIQEYILTLIEYFYE